MGGQRVLSMLSASRSLMLCSQQPVSQSCYKSASFLTREYLAIRNGSCGSQRRYADDAKKKLRYSSNDPYDNAPGSVRPDQRFESVSEPGATVSNDNPSGDPPCSTPKIPIPRAKYSSNDPYDNSPGTERPNS